MQAVDFAGGNGERFVGQAARIEPDAVDAEAVRAKDVGVQAVAHDHRIGLGEGARHLAGVFEEAGVRLGEAAGFGRRDERQRRGQARTGDAPVLDRVRAVGDDAHFADPGQRLAQRYGAIDQHDGIGEGFAVHIAGNVRIEVDPVVGEGLAKAFDAQEVLRHGALFKEAPQRDVGHLVLREQDVKALTQIEVRHRALEGSLFGSPEIEQGVVEVKQEKSVFHCVQQ